MHYIVNLSSVITYNIGTTRKAFKDLCSTYSEWFWASSCCPTFFNSPSWLNMGWLAWIEYNTTEISEYKLGKMSTEEFLEKLCDKFNFLLDKDYPPELIRILYESSAGHLVQVCENENNKRVLAKASLERAWTAGISVTPLNEKKIAHFLELTEEGHSVSFIANTNYFDIHRILYLLEPIFRKHNIELFLEIPDGGESFGDGKGDGPQPFQIAKNIYLSTSYHYGTFKTALENQQYQGGTPNLTICVINERLRKGDLLQDIQLISQYPKDLQAAVSQFPKMPRYNMHRAERYYYHNCDIEIKKTSYCQIM